MGSPRVEVSEECTSPISTISDCLSWNQQGNHWKSQNTSCIDAVTSVDILANRPKVLLCHDMKGGYLADRYNNGCKKSGEDGFGFSFWDWLNIDIFVYFSHELVTVPPSSWIKSAKSHNVKVLGTFITEFDSGIDIWKTSLNSAETVDLLADKLCDIAKCKGFDGWLLNIENKVIGQTDLVLRLVLQLTLNIHRAIPGGLVIWYDSVTYPSGELNWQNELNTLNETFFDACDGIFLNYVWNDDNLTNSLQMATAKNRQFDVYVGVDVFGRNCYGGGGFNTNMAVKKAVDTNLSVAIFAFGWVFETLPVEEFLKNNQKFWSSLKKILPLKRNYIAPFYTSFSISYGYDIYWLGEKCKQSPWYNLSLESPCYLMNEESDEGINCTVTENNGAYIGSSCLEVTADSYSSSKLFPLEFTDCSSYHLCAAYKFLEGDSCTLSLVQKSDGKILASLALSSQISQPKWNMISTNFTSEKTHTVVIISTIKKCRILLGFIGVFKAPTEHIDHDKAVELIKENLKLYKSLIDC